MMTWQRSEQGTGGLRRFPHIAATRRRFPDCLGPLPEASLTALVDLSLSDLDIAIYFDLELPHVVALTRPIRAALAC